ncbi:hypothetical protein KFL_000210180 [Klebsormidium nitens]|uniref:Uncharacterized protein n=1 Tax=Klebsormidium nitens TaxID=105231 RepID=A0A1Y1HMK6_KLENI|nr:hypothetical protein KFL_000210180 [Klebsormidium nitens]|eukprot:GAQ78932.1 hypothetical protein KFL_000210180 [Klebsormidium nitens]
MPLEELSAAVKAKAHMAVDSNWTVDATVRVLAQQGLEAAYRAFQETFATPPPTGEEELGKRMHHFGTMLLYLYWQQEAFGYNALWCNNHMDRFPEELAWVLGEARSATAPESPPGEGTQV